MPVQLFLLLWIILFFGGFIYMKLSQDVYKILKERHPEFYKKIGSPTYLKSEFTNNNLPLLSFLFKNKWEQIDDKELTLISKAFKWVFTVQVIAGLIVVVYVNYYIFIDV